METITDKGGRPAIELTPEEYEAFQERFAVVHYHSTGYAYVIDTKDGKVYRFSVFERVFGAKGRRWLGSTRRREFYSEEGWQRLRQNLAPLSEAALAILPIAETRR